MLTFQGWATCGFFHFSGWTEPIHWVFDRNFQTFWLNGSRSMGPCAPWGHWMLTETILDLGPVHQWYSCERSFTELVSNTALKKSLSVIKSFLNSRLIIHFVELYLYSSSWPRLREQLLGSFSIDDGNGSDNVSFKMNSRSFNLCGVYSNLLKIAKVGEFPGVDFLRTALKIRKKRFVVACLRRP